MDSSDKPTPLIGLAASHGWAPFILFAAHAPDVPETFPRLPVRRTQEARPDVSKGGAWMQMIWVEYPETDMERLVRWRMSYAAAMVSALPNKPDRPADTKQ